MLTAQGRITVSQLADIQEHINSLIKDTINNLMDNQRNVPRSLVGNSSSHAPFASCAQHRDRCDGVLREDLGGIEVSYIARVVVEGEVAHDLQGRSANDL